MHETGKFDWVFKYQLEFPTNQISFQKSYVDSSSSLRLCGCFYQSPIAVAVQVSCLTEVQVSKSCCSFRLGKAQTYLAAICY